MWRNNHETNPGVSFYILMLHFTWRIRWTDSLNTWRVRMKHTDNRGYTTKWLVQFLTSPHALVQSVWPPTPHPVPSKGELRSSEQEVIWCMTGELFTTLQLCSDNSHVQYDKATTIIFKKSACDILWLSHNTMLSEAKHLNCCNKWLICFDFCLAYKMSKTVTNTNHDFWKSKVVCDHKFEYSFARTAYELLSPTETCCY